MIYIAFGFLVGVLITAAIILYLMLRKPKKKVAFCPKCESRLSNEFHMAGYGKARICHTCGLAGNFEPINKKAQDRNWSNYMEKLYGH